MIKTILVPATGSDLDIAVFRSALTVARAFAAHVEVLHVHVDATAVAAAMVSQTDFADLSPRSPAIFGSGSESECREPVISSVTGRQLGCLPNMIQLPLIGVVNAASAASSLGPEPGTLIHSPSRRIRRAAASSR